jgi:hypothetical protein
VGVVACRTSTALTPPRMIGVNVFMAASTGRPRRRAHAVRLMTILTSPMSLRARLPQGVHCVVAALAGHARALFKVVRLVATDTLGVATFEECRLGDQRLLRTVTLLAGTPGFGCRRVLTLMAGGAHLELSPPPCGVTGMHILVAILARRGDRCLSLMGLMTAGAAVFHVYEHGRQIAVRMVVAATAVVGEVRGMWRVPGRFPQTKLVAVCTVGARADTEASLGLKRGMRRLSLRLVALRTTLWGRRAKLRLVDGVTIDAASMPLAEVTLVPTQKPRAAPLLGNVHPSAWFARFPQWTRFAL